MSNRYETAASLQEVFRNKDTGAPLVGGLINTYVNDDRNTRKPIYKYSGSPGNPAYTELPNPYTLDLAGAASDLLYFYPYDANGNDENYYIEVTDANGVQQFVREAFPEPIDATPGEREDVNHNIFPDGQFDMMIDSEVNNSVPVQHDKTVTYGNWFLLQTNEQSGLTLSYSFDAFDVDFTIPEGNPRQAINIVQNEPATSAVAGYLGIKLRYSNTFSGNDEFTLSFWAKANNASSQNFETGVEKIYNSSPTTQILSETTTLTQTWKQFVYTFSFGEDTGKNAGADDYILVYFEIPEGITANFSMTSVLLTKGTYAQPNYPVKSLEETTQRSLGQTFPVPNPDGSDLYLPLKLAKDGFIFDTGIIGSGKVMYDPIEFTPDGTHPVTNLLICHGQGYRVSDYSPLGIPFQRLATVLYKSQLQTYKYGTGSNFVTCVDAGTDILLLSANTTGQIADSTAGNMSLPMATVFRTQAPSLDYVGKAYIGAGGTNIFVEMPQNTSSDDFTAGTSGFTATMFRQPIQSQALSGLFNLTITVVPAAGHYFTYGNIYVWYTVDGAGSSPALPGKTGLQVNIQSTWSTLSVAIATMLAISNRQGTSVTFPAASSITTSQYWTFESTGGSFYVWYDKDNTGNDPAVSGKTGIEVDITSTMTARDVMIATLNSINKAYVGVPDMRGYVPRVGDDGRGIDTVNRYADGLPFDAGQTPGTIQHDGLQYHDHGYQNVNASPPGSVVWESAGSGPKYLRDQTSAPYGFFNETTVRNKSIELAIYY